MSTKLKEKGVCTSSTRGGGNKGQRQRKNVSSANIKCFCCGKNGHSKNECRFKSYACNFCKKVGHLEVICKAKSRGGKSNSNDMLVNKKNDTKGNNKNKFHRQNYVNELQQPNVGNDQENEMYDLTNLFVLDNNVSVTTNERVRPINVSLKVENKVMSFEVDSGACVSVISEQCYRENFSNVKLQETNLILSSYTNQPIKPVGKIAVNVEYESKIKQLNLYVISKGAHPLMGRDWIRDLQVTVRIPENKKINTVSNAELSNQNDVLNKLFNDFSEVFTDRLGCYKGEPAKLEVRENITPKFFKPRVVPFALKDKIEKELDRLVEIGILSPVNNSEFGTPIVPVLKKDGNLRICGDFKVTINPYLVINRHPIPRIEDLFNNLQKGETFSKIDLSQAYTQVKLDEESKKYCTLSTSKGLFTYNRVPYGIASAPGIFQKIMEQLLMNIPGVSCFLDDIIISGQNQSQHLERLIEVCKRLRDNGLTVTKNKCQFFCKQIEYLGYVLSKEGLSTSPSKVDAILNAPTPTNVTQVKSFMGLVQYYQKFVPQMSNLAYPMYKLLRKDVPFNWDANCQKAFEQLKAKLVTAPVLAHYDANLPLCLATDSSAYGLGCVLSQTQKDGSIKPICFASRTLSKAETAYSVIDKEALAIMFGVKRFNQYLYGRKFTLITDHKPLLSIFGPKKGLPAFAASRLQRYALFLSNYEFDIKYVKSEDNANADCLSRLPLNVKQFRDVNEVTYVGTYLQFISDNEIPLKFTDIKRETQKDPDLSKIYGYVMYGWPNNNKNDQELNPYFLRQNELTVEQGILMWGYRVIVPKVLRMSLLKELHSGHLGIVKMKSIARSYLWWPSVDKEIEEIANSCSRCLLERANPAKSMLHVWEYPKRPWERIHLDFLGPIHSKMYLIIVDAYTKWLEVEEVSSTSAKHTISKIRPLFARFGLPQLCVSDNGPPFSSVEFKQYLEANGIKQVLVAPYHPASNGQAENSVKNVKRHLKHALYSKENVDVVLNRFLLAYRNSVHSTTNETPAKLMFNRPLRTRLDLIRPSVYETVTSNQDKQIRNAGGNKVRDLVEGQPVLVRDYRGKNKWIEGIVSKRISPVCYLVKLGTGIVWKRHIDQLIGLNTHVNLDNECNDKNVMTTPADLLLPGSVNREHIVNSTTDQSPTGRTSLSPATPEEQGKAVCKHSSPQISQYTSPARSAERHKQTTPVRRYPPRERKPVVRLNL